MKNQFNQLCVWPATMLGESTIEEFAAFFQKEFGVRVKYKCEVTTLPDLNEDGSPVPETGGRSDLLFYIHDEDIAKFAVPRLQVGIRWWEDVIKYNDGAHLYLPQFIAENPPTW